MSRSLTQAKIIERDDEESRKHPFTESDRNRRKMIKTMSTTV
jgi:hypothetical protein